MEEEVCDVEVQLDGRGDVVVGRGALGDHVHVVHNVQREERGAARLGLGLGLGLGSGLGLGCGAAV